jgi:hypothetical protein
MLTQPLVSNPLPPPEPPPPLPPLPPPRFWPQFWILFALGLLAKAIAFCIQHYFDPTLLTLYLDVHEYASASTLNAIDAAVTLIIIALTVLLGLAAARALGIRMPIIEAIARRDRIDHIFPTIKSLLALAIAVGIAVGLWTLLLHSPLLRSHRNAHEQIFTDDYNQFIHSPAGEKYNQLMDRLSHRLSHGGRGFRVTTTKGVALILAASIDENLFARLFLFSCALWILIKLTHSPPLQPTAKLIWIAIIVAYAVNVSLGRIGIHLNSLIFAPYVAGMPIHGDPTATYILYILRDVALWLPVELALGWLYIRRGLEACILASFIAGLIAEAHYLFALTS